MNDTNKKGFFSRKILFGTSIGAAIFFIIVGMIIWAGFNWTLEATNSEEFCISCHTMEEFVYPDYKKSAHYSNRTGVRATCSDCHVPKQYHHKLITKIRATSDLYHEIMGTISTREKYEAKHHEMSQGVWRKMKASDSRECRNCHEYSQMNAESQDPDVAERHEKARAAGKTCIDCHMGIAHKLSDDFMEEEHEQYLNDEVDCEQCHKNIEDLM